MPATSDIIAEALWWVRCSAIAGLYVPTEQEFWAVVHQIEDEQRTVEEFDSGNAFDAVIDSILKRLK